MDDQHRLCAFCEQLILLTLANGLPIPQPAHQGTRPGELTAQRHILTRSCLLVLQGLGDVRRPL